MGQADKPFGDVDPCSGKSFDSPVAPTSSFEPPPADPKIDVEAEFPNPMGTYQWTPDQAVAQDMIVQQFLNRSALLYKTVGEELVIYQQKEFGEQCACVDRNREQPTDNCLICFGTRFVGGYDVQGKTLGYIGPNPLTKILTELGITLSQKPSLWLLPNPPIRDRDFIVARYRLPATDLMRVQQEPVVRASSDPDKDSLARMNVYRVLHISDTKGGGIDYTENVDYILTGGELVVDDALTNPSSADHRVLRLTGKKFPITPPDGETPTGETDPILVLTPEPGLEVGQTITVLNKRTNPQIMTSVITAGIGPEAGNLVAEFQGASGSNISDDAEFPASEFIATIKGDTILWLQGGNRPADSDTYFISYEASLNITKRYQILNVTHHEYQGVSLVQQAEVQLMDVTHPIYNVNSFFDNGTALDRQDARQRELQESRADDSQMERNPENNSDPRFVNPGDFNL